MNNIITRLFGRVSGKALTRESLNKFSVTDVSYLGEDSVEVAIANVFDKSLYLSTALKKVKDAVSKADFELYAIKNARGEMKRLGSHPVLDLLYNPNDYQTKTELERLMVVSMLLSGEVFLRKHRGAGNAPEAITLIHPSYVAVKVDKDTGVITYEVSKGGNHVEVVPFSEMVHIKDPDFNNQLRGKGLLTPIKEQIKVEILSNLQRERDFKTFGYVDGIMFAKTGANQEEAQKIKASWNNAFSGSQTSSRLAVVGGNVEYTPIERKVLNIIEERKQIRDDIASAVGVPKALMTSDDVNLANANVAMRQFQEFTVLPMLALFVEALNEQLVIPDFGENLRLAHGKVVLEEKAEVRADYASGVITLNEARVRMGYTEVDGGDEFKTNPTQAPYVQNSLHKKLLDKEVEEKKLRVASYKSATSDPIFKSAFTKAVDSVRRKGEKKVEAKIKEIFQSQKEKALKNLKENAKPEDLFNLKQEKEDSVTEILPVFKKIAKDVGDTTTLPVKTFFNTKEFVIDEKVTDALKKRAKFLSESFNETTYNAISDIVYEYMSEGVEVVKSKLVEKFDEMDSGRALTIARTESCNISSLSTQLAFEQNDIIDGKEWLTSMDDKVREEHQMNEGIIVSKTEAFPNGEHYPAESSINC